MLLVKSIITKETVSSHSGVYVGTTKGGGGGGKDLKKHDGGNLRCISIPPFRPE